MQPTQSEEGKPRKFAVRIAAKMQGSEGAMLPPAAWIVWGRVRPVLALDHLGVGFGDSQVEGQPPPVRIVTVKTRVALDGLDARCNGELLAVKLSRRDKDTHLLTIQPRSD